MAHESAIGSRTVSFERNGQIALVVFFGICTLLLLAVAWGAPEFAPFLPAALLGALAAPYLFARPLLNLCIVVAGFVTVMDHQAGFQVQEVVFGLYQYGYLAYWFVRHLFLFREKVLVTVEDQALFFFLLFVTLSIPVTVFLKGDMMILVSEYTALVLLAFYFPVKEACVRYHDGTRAVLLVLAFIAMFVAVRNFLDYRSGINNAKYAYQILRGRVITNDHVPMAASLMALVFLVFAEGRKQQLLLLATFLAFFGSLILTLSRGYWLAFAFGALWVFMMVSLRYRYRFLVLGVSGVTGFVILGLLLFGDVVTLIFGGLLARLLSIGSAQTSDLSLMSRFVEARGVWAMVSTNPVMGHGMAVSYHFFDIITHTTVERNFIHNGYLSLWYRFGLWGLALILIFWIRSIWRGMQLFRLKGSRMILRLAGLSSAGVLIAFVLSSITSNPFYLSDSLIVFAILPGLISGAYQRARIELAAAGSSSDLGTP